MQKINIFRKNLIDFEKKEKKFKSDLKSSN
jgi:hypothetical protein